MTGAMDAPAPDPRPSRRLVWVVRLVFYPVALGLIALAWHQRQADADGSSPHATAPAPAHYLPKPRPARGGLSYAGRTSQPGPHDHVTVLHDGDGETRIALDVGFRCTPRVGPVWATFREERTGTIRLVHSPVTWPSGWNGRADGTIRLRLRGRRAVGGARLRMTLLSATGRTTRCRSGALRFTTGIGVSVGAR